MMIKYLTFAVSIAFISWIAGMLISYGLKKTEFYNKHLLNFNFIKNALINKIIGLGAFKWVVKNTFFKFFNQKIKFKAKADKPYLTSIRNEMTNSEVDHLAGFVFVTFFALVKIAYFNYLFASVIMIVNVLMNLYPSLLQQENKRRVDKLMQRLEVRGA